MNERLSFIPATYSLWVKDIDEGRLLRPATDEDKANLPMETEAEFWKSADKLADRVFKQARLHK